MKLIQDIWSVITTGHVRDYWEQQPVVVEPVVAKEEAHGVLMQSIDELLDHVDSQPLPMAPPPPPIIRYSSNMDAPQHKPVYTLSQEQYERLHYATNVGDIAWSVPQPRDDDPAELVTALTKLNEDFEDFLALGLARDVSDNEQVARKVAHSLKLHGRRIRYFAPTETAFYMFLEGDKREIN